MKCSIYLDHKWIYSKCKISKFEHANSISLIFPYAYFSLIYSDSPLNFSICSIFFLIHAVSKDFGLSRGKPNALDHTN